MKKIIWPLMLIIILPTKVFGASIEINCPNSVKVGETITCTIKANHTSLAGLKATVSYSGMDYIKTSNLTDSNMFLASNTGLDGVFDIANNSITLASYTFKATNVGSGTINIACQEMIDGNDFSSISCTGANKTITINEKPQEQTPPTTNQTHAKSTDATLKSIELNYGNIPFRSSKDIYELEVEYDVKSIEIKGIPNHNKATVRLEGDTNLKVGNNTITLKVTAEDNLTTKVYIINITRKEKPLSKNNNLKNIIIDNYYLNFESSKKEYEITIKDETSLQIKVELQDQLSKYEILNNNNLEDKSIITIKVTAENGDINEYKININKENNKNTIDSNIYLIISIILNIILLISLILVIIKNKKILNQN